MTTILLDGTAWDLVLDANGNIALAADPYAISQNVACACRLFAGELWYDTTVGIPYFEQTIGKLPPVRLIEGYLQRAALGVVGVVSARAIVNDFADRRLSATLTFTVTGGATNTVTI